jgi:hypothetical protein
MMNPLRPQVDIMGTFATRSDWSRGGPIIERESMERGCRCGDPSRPVWASSLTTRDWSRGSRHRDAVFGVWLRGPTPLIAAMRCYVASKLGDEVEVPDELIKE